MASPNRKSVGRNVYGEPFKEKYVDLRLSQKQTDGRSLACSSELIVACWESGGGGTVGVVASDRLGQRNPPISLFRGHKGPVQDIEFSPFYTTIFSTASEDGTVKLWDCPGQREAETHHDSVATLSGHDKRVSLISFHPVAEWVLASAGVDGTVRIWDLEVQKCIITMSIQSAHSLTWNYNGSLLACTTKERQLKVLDPRQRKEIGDVKAHDGAKPTRNTWLFGDRVSTDKLLLTTGFSKVADRQFAVWDIRQLKEAIQREDVDRQSGAVQPVFDAGTGLLFLSGKGDGNIRFYEAVDGVIGKVGVYSSSSPGHDIAYLEKRSVDVMKCEVMRAYKKESTSAIQPISFIVPRRNMSEFQEDLFPPCMCGDAVLSAEEWFQGKNDVPLVGSMEPVNGESPFKRHKRPINVGSLLFSRQRELTAVSSAPSVLQKKMTLQGHVLESDKENLKNHIEELEEQLRVKDELIRDRDVKIQQLLNDVDDLRQKAKLPPKKKELGVFRGGLEKLDEIEEESEFVESESPRLLSPSLNRSDLHISPDLGPQLYKVASSRQHTDLSATRQILKEAQAEAKATTIELRTLRQETSALSDVGKLAKEHMELIRQLLEEHNQRQTGSKSGQDSSHRSFNHNHPTTPHEDSIYEKMLIKIARLERRNKELETLFITLRAASNVEKRRSRGFGNERQWPNETDTEILVSQQQQRYHTNSCVPGLSACRGL